MKALISLRSEGKARLFGTNFNYAFLSLSETDPGEHCAHFYYYRLFESISFEFILNHACALGFPAAGFPPLAIRS